MLKLKLHRYFQLFGLYGVLFLIPILQNQISNFSGQEEDYKRKQTQVVVEHMYYDVKRLTCEILGQQATTHDCKKGIYQDQRLSGAIDGEKRVAEDKLEFSSFYWIVYYLFAALGFIGNFIEYRKEYVQSMGTSGS
ncbi:TPA: hypothetical protein KDX59_004746 [Vibrio parahaemolyticus]|nr:hypothetical protein [Vibrio parahaemolyticus]HBC3436659.1 hypothetical protein [Vibrio parahaemolyticus]HBH7866936.1 hypothetical protein [Vibrio parahaemolyticus]